jgi:hypothetical protein
MVMEIYIFSFLAVKKKGTSFYKKQKKGFHKKNKKKIKEGNKVIRNRAKKAPIQA